MGSLRFAGQAPPALVFCVAAIAAAFVAWLYLRETKSLSAPYSYLLPSLRATAVALTILLLSGPVLHRRQVVGRLGRVIFAIDTSQSMELTDSGEADSSPSRMRRSLDRLLGDESQPGWLTTLKESHELDVIGFAEGTPSLLWSSRSDEGEVPTVIEVEADGEATDLSSSLSAALESFDPGSQIDDTAKLDETGEAAGASGAATSGQQAALVMFSDGRDNVGHSAVDLARQLKLQSYAVHTIGVGSPEEPADAGIVSVQTPESVASDGKLAGEIVLKRYGLEEEPLQIRIESAGKTVWQQTISPGANGSQSVPFELDVQSLVQSQDAQAQRGVQRSTIILNLNAAIQPLNTDSWSDNNSQEFRVAASTRDRQLMIVDGSSRWETRYLKNLFDRDPAWNVNTVIAGEGSHVPSVTRGKGEGQFPDDREEMAKYDAIVLGDVDSNVLSDQDITLLKEYVARGGGLIAIDGRYGLLKKLADGPLSDLIPIRYDRAIPRLSAKSLQLTTMGKEQPLMNLAGQSQNITQNLEQFWSQIPSPQSVNHVQAQEGAEVWAVAVDGSGTKSPWMVTRLFGGGRVFYLSADETWRWRYKVADRFHARFWNQLLSAVMQPPYSASDEYVALGTDKIEYQIGESSTIRARLQNTASMPVGDATVDALLIANDRIVQTVPLAVDDPARGSYQGQTPPLPPGAYTVRIRASGFDQSALQASTPIWVDKPESLETRRVALDAGALQQIATAAGGMYVHESSADSLLEQIKPLSSGSIVESDILLWQSFYWFWAIIVILAIEWWFRKRSGLV